MLNIIERAIVPYNPAQSKIRHRDTYNLYAPVADIDKVGMAGFSRDYFSVTNQIVSLSTYVIDTLNDVPVAFGEIERVEFYAQGMFSLHEDRLTILEGKIENVYTKEEVDTQQMGQNTRLTSLETKQGGDDITDVAPDISKAILSLNEDIDSLQLGVVPRIIRGIISYDTQGGALTDELRSLLTDEVWNKTSRAPNNTDAVQVFDTGIPDNNFLYTYYYWGLNVGASDFDGWYLAFAALSKGIEDEPSYTLNFNASAWELKEDSLYHIIRTAEEHEIGIDNTIDVELLRLIDGNYEPIQTYFVSGNGTVDVYTDELFDGTLIVRTGKAYRVPTLVIGENQVEGLEDDLDTINTEIQRIEEVDSASTEFTNRKLFFNDIQTIDFRTLLDFGETMITYFSDTWVAIVVNTSGVHKLAKSSNLFGTWTILTLSSVFNNSNRIIKLLDNFAVTNASGGNLYTISIDGILDEALDIHITGGLSKLDTGPVELPYPQSDKSCFRYILLNRPIIYDNTPPANVIQGNMISAADKYIIVDNNSSYMASSLYGPYTRFNSSYLTGNYRYLTYAKSWVIATGSTDIAVGTIEGDELSWGIIYTYDKFGDIRQVQYIEERDLWYIYTSKSVYVTEDIWVTNSWKKTDILNDIDAHKTDIIEGMFFQISGTTKIYVSRQKDDRVILTELAAKENASNKSGVLVESTTKYPNMSLLKTELDKKSDLSYLERILLPARLGRFEKINVNSVGILEYGGGIIFRGEGGRSIDGGKTWSGLPSLDGYSFTSAHWANGLWVAGVYHNYTPKIMTTTDTTTWTERTTTNNLIRHVFYAAGLWVAVGGTNGYGDRPAIYYSTDGISWTSVAFTLNEAANGLTLVSYGNGRWVAVAYNGQTITSTNGTNWVYGYDFNTSINSIAYGNGRWIAVGLQTMFTSTDGTSWTSVTPPVSTYDYRKIIYKNNIWVLCGDFSDVFISADGVTWRLRNTGITKVGYMIFTGFPFYRWVFGGFDTETNIALAEPSIF